MLINHGVFTTSRRRRRKQKQGKAAGNPLKRLNERKGTE